MRVEFPEQARPFHRESCRRDPTSTGREFVGDGRGGERGDKRRGETKEEGGGSEIEHGGAVHM